MAVQWYGVFDDALAGEPVVAVGAVVRRYLRREPTRAELTSARRAAGRYSDLGRAAAVRVAAGRGAQVLLLAQPGFDTDADPELLRSVAANRSRPAPRRGAPRSERQVVSTLTRHVCSAGNSARRVDVAKLDAGDAAGYAADLADALGDLERLRARMLRRAVS